MTFRFSCTIKHETDNALLVYDDASEEELWIPLSQVEAIHNRDRKTGVAELEVSEWIAKKKGLL